jgi:[ribosomal protein S18]-alanine N-acetyltransferase
MPENITARYAELADALWLTNLHNHLFPNQPVKKDEFETAIITQNIVIYVLPHVGYCHFRLASDEAECLFMGIAPQHQKKQYGRSLLIEALRILQSKGVKRCLLEVRKSNVAAIGCYEAVGFKQLHIRKSYYKNADGSREDALVLERGIAKA